MFGILIETSCYNEKIDLKKDYVFVKTRETSSVYNIKFYAYYVGESLIDYKIIPSPMFLDSNMKRISLGKVYDIFPPDSSIKGKLVETHRGLGLEQNWGIIEFYQYGKPNDVHF